jgi:uncharacterized protein (TIGR04255 family)
MAARAKPIPGKLKHDAIIEALFEIRFDTATLPEVFFGRLADYAPWKGFDQRRTPAHEIPASFRESDPNLRYQPVFELAAPADHRAVRIGQHVLSYHRTAPYVGWQRFQPELEEVVSALFAKADDPVITRLGFRYINALRSDLHGIRRLSDLDLTFAIAREVVGGSVNVNFTTSVSENTQCTVRIATIDLVQGPLPSASSVLIDVDLFTKESFKSTEEGAVMEWIEFAHTQEKQQFFRLLTDETIDALKED